VRDLPDRRNNHLRDFAVPAKVLGYQMPFYASPLAPRLLRLNGNIHKRHAVPMVYFDLICLNQNIFLQTRKFRICRNFMFHLIRSNIITTHITKQSGECEQTNVEHVVILEMKENNNR
jgi:hypothetical protein